VQGTAVYIVGQAEIPMPKQVNILVRTYQVNCLLSKSSPEGLLYGIKSKAVLFSLLPARLVTNSTGSLAG
jgi:hypothetical protein